MNAPYNGFVKRRASTSGKAALAAEAWRDFWEFFVATRRERDPTLAKHGLTPNDGKALWSLDPGVGKPMGALAGEWLCDASNATWIIDRLEKRGLAERRPSPGDRRVKMVYLTPLGVKIREQVMKMLFKPPSALLELDVEELRAFRGVARKLKSVVGSPEESAV